MGRAPSPAIVAQLIEEVLAAGHKFGIVSYLGARQTAHSGLEDKLE
jgi:hypothetical protein